MSLHVCGAETGQTIETNVDVGDLTYGSVMSAIDELKSERLAAGSPIDKAAPGEADRARRLLEKAEEAVAEAFDEAHSFGED